jgi:hypothetical protein
MSTRLVVSVLVGLAAACAARPPIDRTKYPRRPPGCALAIYRTPVPGVPEWDDLGIAETSCHLNTPIPECLRRLYAEACRMGGDIIYNIPRRPRRPHEQVMVFRGQVAHSRSAPPKPQADDLPPPASAEESAGPVVPLTGAGAAGTTETAPAAAHPTSPPGAAADAGPASAPDAGAGER